jgi:hypothetical protein
MPPPTIARLKSMGADKFRVTCARAFCLHSGFVSFTAAGVEDQAPFPSIAERRRFVCTSCGSRQVSIMPEDWRNHNASGLAQYRV